MILVLDYISRQKIKNRWSDLKSLIKCEKCNVERVVFKNMAIINFNKNGNNFCRKCSNGVRIKNKDYFDLAIKKGLKILDEIPKLAILKIRWQCKYNHIIYQAFSYMKHEDVICPTCSNKNPRNLQDYLDLAEKTNFKFIGPMPKNVKTKTLWLCECKSKFISSYQNIKAGHKCKNCWLKNNSGKNCSFWNPNLTDEERISKRQTPEYNLWSKQIKQKFKFICQKCHKKGGILHSHHIYNWSKYKKLRFNLDNVICICKKCHSIKYKQSFHKVYGQKNNDLFQIEEFIGRQLLEIDRKKLLIEVKNNTIN